MSIREQLTKSVENLHLNKDKWASLEIRKKIFYLDSAKDNLLTQAKYWAESCAMAKGIDLNSELSGQEWLTGPCVVMRALRILATSLLKLNKDEGKNIQKMNDRIVAKVLPSGFYESILWKNFSAAVWIEKGKPASIAHIYKQQPSNGRVCLVLGAGNVSSIPPLDAIYKLYHEGTVCLVKLNPVNDYLLEIFNKVFSELIQDGYLKFVKGDNETSSWLCNHELIDEIHITGSHHTHEAIVWGDPGQDETKARKEKNTPKLNKKITSELGCVTPAIIVPGVWSDAELQFQAKQIVSAVENNASFNCNAVKVLVLCKQWSQREVFLNYLRLEFKNCSLRKAYYPGAKNRYEQFVKNYTQAEKFGEENEKFLPWLFIPNVNPDEKEFALNNEAFCGVLAEVSLEADNPGDFLHKVTNFCNDKLWGTLSCSIFIEPEIERIYKKEFEEAISLLRYGSIGVNCWAALSYALGVTTWGAYPGHTLQDVQSGIGTVHNNFMFDFPEDH